MPQKFFDLVKTAIFYEFLKLRFSTHDRVKRKLGLVTSTQDIGNRSEVVIKGADRRSGWLAKNFRRISMNNLL